jgi:hypothetical protein
MPRVDCGTCGRLARLSRGRSCAARGWKDRSPRASIDSPAIPTLRDPFSATRSSRSVLCDPLPRDPSRNSPEPVRPAARGPRCDFPPKSAPGFVDVGLTRFSMSARRRPSAEACILAASASAQLPRPATSLVCAANSLFILGFSFREIPFQKIPPLRSGPAAFPSGRLIPGPCVREMPAPKIPPISLFACSPGKRPPLSGRVKGAPRRRNRLRRPPGACPHCAACPG